MVNIRCRLGFAEILNELSNEIPSHRVIRSRVSGFECHEEHQPGTSTKTSTGGRLEATVNLLGEGEVQVECRQEDLRVASADQVGSSYRTGSPKGSNQNQLHYEKFAGQVLRNPSYFVFCVDIVSVGEQKGG